MATSWGLGRGARQCWKFLRGYALAIMIISCMPEACAFLVPLNANPAFLRGVQPTSLFPPTMRHRKAFTPTHSSQLSVFMQQNNDSPTFENTSTDPLQIGTKALDGNGPSPPPKEEYTLYGDRWVQLGILSLLALLSDWACFAAVGSPKAWIYSFKHNPEELVDLFLCFNVAACFLFTDITRIFGLRKVVTTAAGLMAVGCALRSGLPFGGGTFVVPDYTFEVAGTALIGLAQPFFQCTPPLLSATWFGNKERAMSTAVCLNANQLGIATSFVLGGAMLSGRAGGASMRSLDEYLVLLTGAASVAFVTALVFFKDRPPTPPTASAAKHIEEEAKKHEAIASGKEQQEWFTYPRTFLELVRTPGFLAPTLAFVGSIAVTNLVSAFTSEDMMRAGFKQELTIDELGAAFQIAVMGGGIVLGGFVDQTKEYKRVTLACFTMTIATLVFLGFAEGYDLNLPPWAVIASLLTLGASAGPVQPINAELAVEVSYPADENAVEATQQLAGNLFSALLVPISVAAARFDFPLPGHEDIRGDTLVLIGLVTAVSAYFSTFNAKLRRLELDGGSEEAG